MGNSGRGWVIIGAIMIIIGIVFAGITSYFLESKIEKLVQACEKEGGNPIVEKSGFIVTTSFEYECKK
ncbi:hypothetical protein [Lysinibacillus sp. SGAir0095]|uniref:hypothetical protein n=1 Tax=Lysinibacillus sp. SGAir0095 TaxID=2070463 RepID=UPI0010CD3412|nr:hypothetical protein [Lysinibacillus sp. SGAir0095]QCR32910.1 hypothetical protein C1N55_12320 [Lysinibacillus sp. SGAir0095]